jgi:hypothetical protein
VRPSPPLLHHARRCGDTPALLGRTTPPRRPLHHVRLSSTAPSNPFLVTTQDQTMTLGRRPHHSRRCQPRSAIPAIATPRAHCYNYSNTIEHAGTGRHHTCHCSLYGPLSMAPSSPLEATPVNHYASTLEAAPVRAQDAPRHRDWNQIRQDGHQLYCTVCHTATRIEIVQRTCKPLPPWPIKGGAAPSCRGQTRDDG